MPNSREAIQSAQITGSITSWLIMISFAFLKILSDTPPGLMSQSVRGVTVTVDTTQRLLFLVSISRKKSTTSDSEKFSKYENFSSKYDQAQLLKK